MSDGMAVLVAVGSTLLLFGLVTLGLWVSDRCDKRRTAIWRVEHDALQDAVDALTPADRSWLTEMGYRPPAGIFWRVTK